MSLKRDDLVEPTLTFQKTMFDVITTGETMALLTPSHPGLLRHAGQVELRIGGAESNVAIALVRLGFSAGWASWIGADELGELLLARIRGEGVDTSQVRRLKEAPTGLYLREMLATGVKTYYYRRGSAASCMRPGAFDPAYLDKVQFLHLGGITPALSNSCRDFTLWAIQEARNREVRVSFDVNYRSKLWGANEARFCIEEFLPLVDIFYVNEEEILAIWEKDVSSEHAPDLERIFKVLQKFAQYGPEEVILKRGISGSILLSHGELVESPSCKVNELDPTGAGDAFAAGYMAGWLWGYQPRERLQIACALGAYSVMYRGDYEGLPNQEDLKNFIEGNKVPGR